MAGNKPDELSTLIEALTRQVYEALAHLEVSRGLSVEFAKDPAIGNLAHVFFLLTIRSNADAVILNVSKLFDRTKGVANLDLLFKIAEKKANTFERIPKKEVISLVSALRKESEDLRGKLEAISARRNQIIAHLSKEAALKPEVYAEAFGVTFAEVEELCHKTGQLINRLSSEYRNVATSMRLVGSDDYQNVLRYMRIGREAQQKEVKDELEKLSGGSNETPDA